MHLLISSSPIIKFTWPFTIPHSTTTRLLSSYTPRSRNNKLQPFLIHSSSSLSMEDQSKAQPEVLRDFSPYLKIYKDGRVERLKGIEISPPTDPKARVLSKDVVYSTETGLSSRVYLPRNTTPDQKLPVYVYFHGGGFCVETAFSPIYHNYVNNQVADANVIAVSVDYRRTPEFPLPAAYEDSWAALKWVASHFNGDGPEEWLNSHADFTRVYLGGDSAGANIAHQVALKFAEEKIDGIHLAGVVLAHPYFWGKEPIGNEVKDVEQRAQIDAVWRFSCPSSTGCDDPWINPVLDPKFAGFGCKRVLVIVAEKDILRERGLDYYDKLKKSGWDGVAEIEENKEQDHVFHLENFECEQALALICRISSFINGE